VLLGVLLSTFLTRSLEQDVDQRLLEASNQVLDQSETIQYNEGRYFGESESDATNFDVQDVQVNAEFETLVTSGLFVVAIDTDRNILLDEGFVPKDVLDLVNLETLRGGREIFQTVSADGQRIRIHSIPVFVNQAGPDVQLGAAFVVGESLERQDHAIEELNQLLLAVGAAGVLLATWGGWVLAGRAISPVNRIIRTADAIARQGDAEESLTTRLDVHRSGDELSRLSLTFNDMLERIERAFRAQRRFVADASHELRTPLTAIRGNVDVLYRHSKSGREIDSADLQESLGDMQRESARMARLIEDLLMLARTDAQGLGHMVHPEPISIDVIAREAFRTAESVSTGQKLQLTIPQPLMIYGDADRLVQVMIVLLDNAIRHTPAGESVELIVDTAGAPEGTATCARIQVVDHGEGIAPEHLPHLFERFYRIEDSRSRLGGGSGLGLAIALAIVRGHNGWIQAQSPEGSGTRFIVLLPILDAPEPDTDSIPILPRMRESHQPLVQP
jgi:signal transduction histidine kinase